MDEKVYQVCWRSTPDGVEIPEGQLCAGALVSVWLKAEWLEDALTTSREIVIDAGWSPDAQPNDLSVFYLDQLDEGVDADESFGSGMPTQRELVLEAHANDPVIVTMGYEQDDPEYNEGLKDYIWVLDWMADYNGDPHAADIDDACACILVFRGEASITDAYQAGYEMIEQRGWTPDDEPVWIHRVSHMEREDRIHPQYQIAAMEAFRDGYAAYIQPFPREGGYPERAFPLVSVDDEESL